MFDKKANTKVSLNCRTTQWAGEGCRYTHVEAEEVNEDIHGKKEQYNYYPLFDFKN